MLKHPFRIYFTDVTYLCVIRIRVSNGLFGGQTGKTATSSSPAGFIFCRLLSVQLVEATLLSKPFTVGSAFPSGSGT